MNFSEDNLDEFIEDVIDVYNDPRFRAKISSLRYEDSDGHVIALSRLLSFIIDLLSNGRVVRLKESASTRQSRSNLLWKYCNNSYFLLYVGESVHIVAIPNGNHVTMIVHDIDRNDINVQEYDRLNFIDLAIEHFDQGDLTAHGRLPFNLKAIGDYFLLPTQD